MEEPEVSRTLLQQRIRNGIVRYLETAASADDQREYQRAVPLVCVSSEMINQWEDWVREDDLDWYGPPVFSREESRAIRDFHTVWSSTADLTPDPMPEIDTLFGTPVWDRFMAAARAALQVFTLRGPFDQDVEENFTT
ncbi:MAG: hypothetical protein JWP35_2151 [Caulobacter sp.]|nr:hypothetical protein [Caulobacter sp.]